MSYRDISKVGVFTALLVVASWLIIPLPFGVPFSLQPLAVFIIVYMLRKNAWKSILTYLLLGALGLPVFAGFSGGIAKLIGPTGGFLFGFLLASILVFIPKINDIVLGFLEIIVIYFMGIVWFKLYKDMSFFIAFKVLVPPFILWDIIKLFVAYSITKAVEKRLQIETA